MDTLSADKRTTDDAITINSTVMKKYRNCHIEDVFFLTLMDQECYCTSDKDSDQFNEIELMVLARFKNDGS